MSSDVSHDAAWLADYADVTIQEADVMLANQETFGVVLATLRSALPEKFADAWITYRPYTLSVSFVGDVPPLARRLFDESGLTVSLVPDAPLSEASLEELQSRASKSLTEAGFDGFSVTFDAQRGQVLVTLPESARDAASLPPQVLDEHVKVTYTHSPVAIPMADVRGGGLLNGYNDADCTAGFSVENSGGTGGIATAGHCQALSNYEWVGTGETTPLTWLNQHVGDHGDVEWHSTPSAEVPEFYSGTWGVRDVTSVEQTDSFARGALYCKFGQTSGYGCSTVWRVAGDCDYEGWPPAKRLVIMDESILRGGDSGGPWFIASQAAGISSGDCYEDGRRGSAFSKASLLGEAMNVHVRRK